MRKIFVLIILFIAIYAYGYSQGCVAIRSSGASCTRPTNEMPDHGWQLNFGYRYFKSYKHFVGKEEQKERVENGTDVRNWQTTFDIGIVKTLNKRWSLGLNLPLLANTRSSKYEHYGNASTSPNARRSTHAFGLGDMRIAAYYWLMNPATHKKGNIQAGLGLKLATGDYRVQDFFYKNDTISVLGPVDQSIQLGDGGTGFTIEINGFYTISHTVSLYGNFYYLINPREQNGVSTARGGIPTASAIQYGTSTMSVPDQYLLRGGANFMFNRFAASTGIRMECIPSTDLIGGSSGFRRPGYIITAEPGVSYMFKHSTIFLTTPIAVERNRTQSYSDKLRTDKTGVYTHGDAAFADYSINLGASFRF